VGTMGRTSFAIFAADTSRDAPQLPGPILSMCYTGRGTRGFPAARAIFDLARQLALYAAANVDENSSSVVGVVVRGERGSSALACPSLKARAIST
jgi:hypothetical protein